MNVEALESCVDSPAARDAIQVDLAAGNALGIASDSDDLYQWSDVERRNYTPTIPLRFRDRARPAGEWQPLELRGDAPGALLAEPSWFSRWVPVALWAAVIWTLSTGWFDGDGTGGFFLPILGALFPLSGARVAGAYTRTHAEIRSPGRVSRSWQDWSRGRWRDPSDLPRRWVGRQIAICVLWAGLDEYHQSFVPTRVGAAQDVLLDTTGAGFGYLLYRWRRVSLGRRSRV